MTAEVVLYSRPGCHLCEEALEELIGLHEAGYRFALHEVDIESDEALLRRMLERIPVVEVNGEVVSELILDRASVAARLDTVVTDDDRAGSREGSQDRLALDLPADTRLDAVRVSDVRRDRANACRRGAGRA